MAKRFSILLLILWATAVSAVAASFSLVPPRRVVEGEKFAVTFRLDNAEGSDIRVSQINGCTFVYGPAVSTSRSYTVVNGKAQSASRTEYTYTYRADRAGTFTIPAASIMVDGKRLTTSARKFTVETHAQANAPASSRPVDIYDPDTQGSDRGVGKNDVFVRIILSSNSVYEQQPVECVIKLYTKYNISQFIPTKQPSFDGFLIEEVPLKPTLNVGDMYNGQRYYTAVLKKCIIFPQKSGRLTINSGNYDIDVVQYSTQNLGGFATIRQPQERKITVSSNSATLDVKALPQPRPEGFNGAVGKFTVSSRLVGNRFRSHEPATLIYTIEGTGNIKYLKEPAIDFPDEFEVYTPKSNIEATAGTTNVSGKMTIEYTFVPQTEGSFTIGADKFVYFDPATGKYVTLTTPSYDLKVAKGTAPTASADQKDIESKNSDILHIKLGEKKLSKSHTLVVDSFFYWLLYILLAAGMAAVIILNRRRLTLNADIKGRRLARAGRTARAGLSRAEARMKANNSEAFYAEILKTVNGYLSDKFGIAAGQLSRETISEAMNNAGASDELTASVLGVIDSCEMARYTPQTPATLDDVFRRAGAVIADIENLKPRNAK